MSEILTLDAGTSALKCSLFDENGELRGACTADYKTYYPKEGFAEQDADEIMAAAVSAVRQLAQISSLDRVDAIGLTGTMNGCIPLDGSGRPLYRNMIHLDTRGVKQVERLENALGMRGFYERTGNRPDVHYGLPKLMWLKEFEPDVYKAAQVCVNTKDVLYGFLTGIYGRSDYSDASLFGCMNIHTRTWDSEVAAAAQIDIDKLPELRPSYDVSGRLSKATAELMGLKAGIPVAIGAGDGPATTHGSGVYDETGAYLTVGSSAWVGALSKTPCIDGNMRAFNYTDMDETLVTVCGTVQCAATALDYMLGKVLNVTDETGNIDFAAAEKLCMQSPLGAKGLYFVPTLMGERSPWWDPKARGVLIGLTLTHERSDMVRAVYEGIAQELNNNVAVLRENGIKADKLILSGGGMRSNIFKQLFPDVFGASTQVHLTPREATSLGAAIAAGVGTGIWRSFAEAAKCVKTGSVTVPNPENMQKYAEHAKVFRKLYELTAEAMHLVC